MELRKLRPENLGYFNQSRLPKGDQGELTAFEFESKSDVILIAELLNQLGYSVINLMENEVVRGRRVGRLVSNMPFSESIRLQSGWHSEIVPIVSGETEKRSKVNQAKKDHAKKVREEMITKATPSYVEVCQPGLGAHYPGE